MARHRRGFSMIELMVSIGVLSILVGLMLPALSGSLSRAKLTADMVRMRDAANMIGVYTADYRGVYPISDLSPGIYKIGKYWLRPMLAGGYYGDIREIDNYSDAAGSDPSVMMSAAMAYDWRRMIPGQTVDASRQYPRPVRTDQVVFPSLKGLVFRAMSDGPPRSLRFPTEIQMFCCTQELWEFPVANADASAVSGHWRFFNGGRPLHLENDVGMPVLSTWSGVRGVDR
ncbi:MAG: type II secretion system GspH family protein [Phycisphaerales bacterium]|nr:type II secretion system protein [Planctomycetota bacterium]MCH8509249.1 type II secretion system GspH family protein [Phycisphaerales bacterium]